MINIPVGVAQFCDVPPAGHEPAPASRRDVGTSGTRFMPPFTPRKPRPKIDDQRQVATIGRPRSCSSVP
jgi:hypothetical protein